MRRLFPGRKCLKCGKLVALNCGELMAHACVPAPRRPRRRRGNLPVSRNDQT